MTPTRPFLIVALLSIGCVVILLVASSLLLNERRPQDTGRWLGASSILGSLIATGLAERMYDIRADLIRTQCNCDPFQWSDPRITTPLMLGIPLCILLLVFTAYSGVRTLSVIRHAQAAATQSSDTPDVSFSAGIFLLTLIADVGVWITAVSGVSLPYAWYLIVHPDPADDLAGIPIFYAFLGTGCGMLMLLVPFVTLLRMLLQPKAAQ